MENKVIGKFTVKDMLDEISESGVEAKCFKEGYKEMQNTILRFLKQLE